MNNGSFLACLRAWKPNELDLVDPLFTKFLPFVDNQLIVAQPAALYNEGKFKQVPVLMGTNLYEGNFFALLFLGVSFFFIIIPTIILISDSLCPL